MNKTDVTADIIKAAASNPNFNPLDERQWRELFSYAPLIRELVEGVGKSSDSAPRKQQIL